MKQKIQKSYERDKFRRKGLLMKKKLSEIFAWMILLQLEKNGQTKAWKNKPNSRMKNKTKQKQKQANNVCTSIPYLTCLFFPFFFFYFTWMIWHINIIRALTFRLTLFSSCWQDIAVKALKSYWKDSCSIIVVKILENFNIHRLQQRQVKLREAAGNPIDKFEQMDWDACHKIKVIKGQILP